MRAEWVRLFKCAVSGGIVSATLWVTDLLSIRTLRFAGADDPDAQERVVGSAIHSIVALEIELLLLYAIFGLVIGAMVAATRGWLRRIRKGSPRRDWPLAATVVFLAHGSALLGMVGRYPQLYADRWWLGGGPLATVQRTVTHIVGPLVFDLLFTGLMLALVLGTLLRIAGVLRAELTWNRLRWTGLFLVVLAVPLSLSMRTIRQPDGTPPNVLILCIDSLRTDRLKSADVMPFSSSLLPESSFYRFAFTPIARTYPSWVSLLTGTEPKENAVRTMFPSLASRRDIGPTFVSTLRDTGYHTFVVSDFAGDIFHGFEAGFETVDTPELNIDTLAQSAVFGAHNWALPLLRSRLLRKLFPIWRNQPSIADPAWLAREALLHVRRARQRPFAGVVFFSTAHFPYTPPHPYYKRGAQSYRGPYLYHVPQNQAGRNLSERDVEQVRALYDAALTSVDDAVRWLVSKLDEGGLLDRTILVITGDHGEELYDRPGIAGHGDFVDFPTSQAVPILIKGPGVPPGEVSNRQVRLYDLAPTVLDLLGQGGSGSRFGDGVTLGETEVERPICVETGIWFFPTLPAALRGKRLEYPGIAQLLDIESETREMVLRPDMEGIVETAKQRGVILGNRLWRERLAPAGLEAGLARLPGVEDEGGDHDLRQLFEERCVASDASLHRFFEAIVYQIDSHDSLWGPGK